MVKVGLLSRSITSMLDKQVLTKFPAFALAAVLSFHPHAVFAEDAMEPIIIGLDADMSSGSAQGGEAIRRGAEVAIDQINTAGGVLGRKLQLIVKDHRGNPARGVDNILDFADMENVVAVLGGVHTPVAMAELETLHENQLIYLGPWAAGTPIVDNKFDPNFVFRASVRDEFAGGFLIEAAIDAGFKQPGLLLWQTGWGRSNEVAMTNAVKRLGLETLNVEWFNSGEPDMIAQIERLTAKGSDVIMLVANAGDTPAILQSMAQMEVTDQLPFIAHWGMTGGDFFEQAALNLSIVDLTFLQTFSFSNSLFPDRAKVLYDNYCNLFGPCNSTSDVLSPVGVAHAYDLVHLLSLAIKEAGSIDRPEVRTQLENIAIYQGVMRDYNPPFTADRHDALDASDFHLSKYDENGAIVPIEQK